MDAERQFQHELEVFRTEAESATQFLFGYLAVHAVASDKPDVVTLLNTAPLFWNTALAGLQQSAHIVLGRIFDQNSQHNLDTLLRLAQRHPAIFSKQALRRRKEAASANAAEWIDGYIDGAYEPAADDFRRLRAHVAKRRKVYDAKYRDIRNKYFAHREISGAQVNQLFSQTTVQEMQRMCVFLQWIHEALLQLFMNGRKPVLRRTRYSTQRIRKKPSQYGGQVQERITHEAERFLLAAVSAAKHSKS